MISLKHRDIEYQEECKRLKEEDSNIKLEPSIFRVRDVIKKGNAYNSFTTSTLKFLDISAFLAPGTNYVKFLKAYDREQKKAWFPYEFLTDAALLDHPRLPDYETFWSSLKSMNVLESEYIHGFQT